MTTRGDSPPRKPAPVRPTARGFAFGPRAKAYLKRLQAFDLPVIVCDGTDVELALAKAVELRRSGTAFYCAPLLVDPHALTARHAAHIIRTQLRDADELRVAFESLALGSLTLDNKNIREIEAYALPVLATMREFVLMGDALLVRSQRERRVLESLLTISRQFVACIAPPNLAVPAMHATANAQAVVVWAPDATPADLAIYDYALRDRHETVYLLAPQPLADSKLCWVPPDSAASVLAEAAVIIDTNLDDPGTAIAFAERGFGVMSPMTNGADEHIHGLISYDPASYYSIHGGISRARANRRNFTSDLANKAAEAKRILAATIPLVSAADPLVSIIMPTYNRREQLRKSLQSFRRQTYRNFEVIVVNDCGTSVDDIVAEFPFARLTQTAQNSGGNIATNLGFRMARGQYLGFVPDDDLLYPDHIAKLSHALRTSKLPVAHSNIVMRLVTPVDDGRYATRGHTLIHHNDVDATALSWAGCPTMAIGYLMTREALEAIDYIDERQQVASDMVLILKLAQHFDFAHVHYVTGEMVYADDGSNQSARAGQALVDEVREVLAQHAPADRKLIDKRIEETLKGLAIGQAQQYFFNPWIPLRELLRE